MKRLLCTLICLFLATGLAITPLADAPYPEQTEDAGAENDAPLPAPNLPTDAPEGETLAPFEIDARSAVLMEAETGRVLACWNGSDALPPASVTKIMTLLLVMEAIDGGRIKLTDTVQVSEYAASMGGSQVFLKAGEQMTVEDLLKSVVIASANDGAVALSELVSGDVEAFVAAMNRRAEELGMKNSHFENPTGLDDSTVNHVFSAMDIAIASRELITKHPTILTYSSTWMDSIRNGAFGLTNTNRLVRFYKGATGLKTGSTSKALYCMSATAEREGLSLIAVVMGAKTRDARNALAKKLLDYGFSRYESVKIPGADVGEVKVIGGRANALALRHGDMCFLVEKGRGGDIVCEMELPEEISAPIREGQTVGWAIWRLDDEELGRCPVVAVETVERIRFGDLFLRLLRAFCLCFEENRSLGVDK